jgi:hypothetical protein
MKEIADRIAGVPAEIQTEYFKNTRTYSQAKPVSLIQATVLVNVCFIQLYVTTTAEENSRLSLQYDKNASIVF